MRKNSEGRILGIKGFRQIDNNSEAMLGDLNAARLGWTAIFYASSLGHGWGGTVSMTAEEVLKRLSQSTSQEEKQILTYALVTMKKSPLATAPVNLVVKPGSYAQQRGQTANGSPELEAALEKYHTAQLANRA